MASIPAQRSAFRSAFSLLLRRASVLLLLCAALVAASTASGATAADFSYGTITKIGAEVTDMPYRLFVPPSYTPTQSYPVIIFLHGSGEKGTDNTAQVNGNANGAMELISTANQAAYPCLMIAPQCQQTWNIDKLDQIMRLLTQLSGQYTIDLDRVVLTGLSLGGMGTWGYISAQPNVFSAAVPMSGFNPGYIPGAPGPVPAAVDPARVIIPVWAFHAVDDGSVSIASADDVVCAVRAQGRQVLYTRYNTGGHVIWPTAYANPYLLPWMMAQRRGRSPAGTPMTTVTSPAPHVVSTPSATISASGTATMPGGVTSVNTHFVDTPFNPPAYDPATAYATGAAVTYSGYNFIASKPSTGIPPITNRLYWRQVISTQDPAIWNQSLNPAASGTASWSVTGASVSPMPGAAALMLITASGSTWSSLGGTTTVNDYLWITPTGVSIAAPTIAVTSPNSNGSLTTNATAIALGGTAAGSAGKAIAEVSWSNSSGGTGVALGTTAWTVASIALSQGTNVITVTARDSCAISATTTFTVQVGTGTPAPTVSAVTPSAGGTAGGTAVTITGTNFAAGASVSFGGTAATGVTAVSATSITCTAPAHAAGAVAVVVMVGAQSGTLAGGFTYNAPVPAPTVTGVSPATGGTAGGTAVTITGTNFAAGATVSFGGTAATAVTVVSATSITCTAPAHAAGAVAVVVTVSAQSGTLASAFTYTTPVSAPTVTGVSPATGPATGGTAVTITGTNFAVGATVTFGAVAATAVTVVSATSITCIAPAHTTGAVDVTVTSSSQLATRTIAYTYDPVPAPTPTPVTVDPGATHGGTRCGLGGGLGLIVLMALGCFARRR